MSVARSASLQVAATLALAAVFELLPFSVGADSAIRLTDDPANDRRPSFSPDGSRILFESCLRPGNTGECGVWVIPASGGSPAVLYDGDPSDDLMPDWSPDGSEIVFVSPREWGYRHLWVMPANGGMARQLTGGDDYDMDPTYSPDGSTIAFTSTGGGYQIWTVQAAGGPPTQITSLPGSAYTPTWSPDGRYIAFDFSPWPSTPSEVGIHDIWIVPTAGGVAEPLYTSPEHECCPKWSPDGRFIAFASGGDIWILPVGGGDPVRVTDDPASDYLGDWSPDGRRIVFSSLRGGWFDLWVLDLADLPTAVQQTTWGKLKASYR